MQGCHTAPTAIECVAAAIDEVEVAVTLAPPEPLDDPDVLVAASVPTAKAAMPTVIDGSIILFFRLCMCGCVEDVERLSEERGDPKTA